MIATWFKGSLLLAATLSAGITIGVMSERARVHHAGAEPAVAMHAMHSHVMHMLNSSLSLDSSQQTGIVQILHKHQSYVDSAWGTLRPHMQATLDSAHTEIMQLLSPGQRAHFTRLVHGHAR